MYAYGRIEILSDFFSRHVQKEGERERERRSEREREKKISSLFLSFSPDEIDDGMCVSVYIFLRRNATNGKKRRTTDS